MGLLKENSGQDEKEFLKVTSFKLNLKQFTARYC